MAKRNNRVKSTNDIELKDRLVAINRVTKVTKGGRAFSFSEQAAKFGGSRVILKPASQGTGVKAGGAMRAVLESVGITDVLCKSKGSSNPHNLVKATFGALDEMRSPMTVAQNRGVSLDVVFNG